VERRKRSENREKSTEKHERDEDEENCSFGASLRHGHQFGCCTATLLRSDSHSPHSLQTHFNITLLLKRIKSMTCFHFTYKLF